MLVAARGFLPRFQPGVGLENSRGHAVLRATQGNFKNLRTGNGDLGKSPIKMSTFSQSEGV